MFDNKVVRYPLCTHAVVAAWQTSTIWLHSAVQVWSPDQVKCSFAVTSDSNKAFIYWASHGEQTDTHEENHFYGLNLLVFNEKGMVKEILGFRQPLASERPKFLKADAKAAAA